MISAKFALGYGFTFLKGGVLNIIGIFTKLRAGITLLRLGMISTRAVAIANGFMAYGRALISVATGAIPAVIGGIKAMTLAMIANPIGLAIAAIAAGAALIIYYWDPIKSFFGKLWDGIKEGAASVWNSITKIVEPIKKVKDMVGSAWNWLFGAKEQEAGKTEPVQIGSTISNTNASDISDMNAKAKEAVAVQSNNSSTVNASITVNASPGMDEKKVAAEVQKALLEAERKADAKKRGANHD